MNQTISEALKKSLVEKFHKSKENRDSQGICQAIDDLRENGDDVTADELQDEKSSMCEFCFDTGIIEVWRDVDDCVERKCFCKNQDDYDPDA